MKPTPLLNLIAGILCLLSVVSVNAADNHKSARLLDKTVQGSFDTLGVSVSQNTKYLMVGQEIEITVQICGNRDRVNKISIGGSPISVTESGTAIYKTRVGGVGRHKTNVDIEFTDSNDKPQLKTWLVEYEVGQACVVIDEENLNLLYIGVDNPLSIYVPAGPYNKMVVTTKGAGSTITRSGSGMYIVRVSTVSDDCMISVFTDDQMTGAKMFRAVNLPAPEATIGEYKSGSRITATEFSNQSGIKVALAGFPFKVDYKVVGYTIKVFTDAAASKSFTSSESQFSPDLKKCISELNMGSVIVINDIVVEEPTGRRITLPALVYFIN